MTDSDETIAQFRQVVNMSPKKLEKWLATDDSRAVGQKKNDGESTGHKSGRKIVKILSKKKSEFSDADVKHMAKVVGYIKRHEAQRPSGDVTDTKWRYSLMNWGHDPLKTDRG